MIRGQDLSSSGHTIGSIDDLFMETLVQKQWNSFPDNSMTELPQDVYFRSYVWKPIIMFHSIHTLLCSFISPAKAVCVLMLPASAG